MQITFNELKYDRYSRVPGDCPWNERGFKGDYTQPTVSEMSAHMPLLKFLAEQCDHVTEFGTRDANSTIAFLDGAKQKVVSYDIQPTPTVAALLAMDLPCEWEFHCHNTIDPNLNIEETDLLFVDTLHTFHQVQQELELHGHKARKWIVFHDVYSQGLASLDINGAEGINRAIVEYMEKTGCWRTVYQVPFNHGLLVIERTGE